MPALPRNCKRVFGVRPLFEREGPAVVRDASRNSQARRPARTTCPQRTPIFACDGVLRSPTPFACKGGVSCSSFAHRWPCCWAVRQRLRPISKYPCKVRPASGCPACRSACFAPAITPESECRPLQAMARPRSPTCLTANIALWCSHPDSPSSRCKLRFRQRGRLPFN